MMTNHDQIVDAVDAFLNDAQITYSVRYVGETVREDNWHCDAWRVSFHLGTQANGYRLPGFAGKPAKIETDYYTGLGCRRETKKPGIKTTKTIGNKWVIAEPVKPRAAGVLQSLLMDGDAVDYCFTDWCANYGYSDDSISALTVYKSCCDIAKQLRQIFTRAQIDELRELLSDY